MNQMTTIEGGTPALLPEEETEVLAAVKAPKTTTLMTEVSALVEMADVIVIDTAETYQLAADDLLAIADKKKALSEQRFAITRPMDAAKKAVMDLFRPAEDKLAQAESTLKHGMLAYDNQQKAIAAAAAKKAEEEAAAERKRLQDIADAAAAEAAAAAASGDTEAAEAAAAQAEAVALEADLVVAAAPPPAAYVPKATGVSTTTRWGAEVTDKIAYIRYVLDEDQSLIDTITIDMKPLNQLAIALKGKFSKPGVIAKPTTGISAGRR